jgi:putative phosphoesterase
VRIAVLADTHSHLPASLRPVLGGADEIWHLGDICLADILRDLGTIGPPVHAIRGNCDPRGIAPETLTLTRAGHTFFLVHAPIAIAPPGAGFVLHGHTHVPRDESIGGIRHLNPGSVSKPNHGAPVSFAWLDIEKDREPRWQIVPVP